MFCLSGKGSGMEANTRRERDDGRQEKTQGDKTGLE